MKKLLCVLLAAAFLASALAGCGTPSSTEAKEEYKPKFNAPAADNGLVFEGPELQFQLLRILGASAYGAADIGESLMTAMQVDESQCAQGDFDTWYDAWNSTAERLKGLADEALARGDETSARDLYLRCNTYYNNAEFYLHGDPSDPRIKEASGKARECFRKAGKLLDPPVEEVRIKYEDTTLPGYFYRVDTSGKKRPLLIMQTGFDGTQEELYSGGVEAALERGYNVLTFEGPGQGEVLRDQGLHFRPDWEKVVTPVVDYAVGREDVDAEKVALWGISMGGYLTARAAAYEHRLKALILDPAMDMERLVLATFGQGMAEFSGEADFKVSRESVMQMLEEAPKQIDEGLTAAMKGNINLIWFLQNGMFVMGVDTPSTFLLKMFQYSLTGVSEKITADTLVCDAEQDVEKYGTMTKDIYESLTSSKDYVLFTNAEGAGAHCQMGATRFGSQVKLDWLSEVPGMKP